MKQTIIFSLIKSPCGRAKYLDLSAKVGFLSQVRLSWFILIATIKDLNLPNPDQSDASNS